MKTRILKIAAIIVLWTVPCFAALAVSPHKRVETGSWKYLQTVNVSYGFADFSRPEGKDLKPDFSLSMSTGRTFYMHKKPIGNALKFSIDLGLELNYNSFDPKPAELGNGVNLHHTADVGLFIGPCFNISPAERFMIRLYGYYVPAANFIVTSQKNRTAFLSSVRTGLELAFGRFGIGCEYFDGLSDYKIPADLSGNSSNGSSNTTTGPLKIKQSGIRVFVSFKFGRSRKY